MVYSPNAVTVDGVSLDGFAWNIEEKVRAVAGVRSGDAVLPGVDGVAASLNDDLDVTTYTLSMWALGTDRNGLVPNDPSAINQCRANIDFLTTVFNKRHALLDVRETVDTLGTVRQAWCKRIDAYSPTVRAGGFAKFTVSLSIPAGLWQDVTPRDWVSSGTLVPGNFYEVTPLRGTAAAIADGIITVTGPVANPQLVDFTSNAYCRLNATLAAGQVWRLNSDTWSTRYGVGLDFSSLDTAGADAQAITRSGGSGTARFFPLRPVYSAGEVRVQIGLAGTGFTAATAIGVRARRKFFQ
jgi:hypothetical protein